MRSLPGNESQNIFLNSYFKRSKKTEFYATLEIASIIEYRQMKNAAIFYCCLLKVLP